MELLGGWLGLVREVRGTPNGRAALRTLWRHILTANDRKGAGVFIDRLLAAAGEEAKEEIVTVADQLREEGRLEGRLEGQRTALVKLLRSRFGALPEAAVARVNRADAAQLDLWFDQALSARTLGEVLGDA